MGDINKVAHLARVDAQDLHHQFEDYLPIAVDFAKSGGESLDAWRSAIETVSKSRLAAKHPSEALNDVLMRMGGYGVSTSGLEQHFARAHGAAGNYRRNLSEGATNDDMDLTDSGLAEREDDVATAAQHIWATLYKSTRTHLRKRIGTGKRKTTKAGTQPSLAG